MEEKKKKANSYEFNQILLVLTFLYSYVLWFFIFFPQIKTKQKKTHKAFV